MNYIQIEKFLIVFEGSVLYMGEEVFPFSSIAFIALTDFDIL